MTIEVSTSRDTAAAMVKAVTDKGGRFEPVQPAATTSAAKLPAPSPN
jgi:hypothetical protein